MHAVYAQVDANARRRAHSAYVLAIRLFSLISPVWLCVARVRTPKTGFVAGFCKFNRVTLVTILRRPVAKFCVFASFYISKSNELEP